jgi:hypothetical protein
MKNLIWIKLFVLSLALLMGCNQPQKYGEGHSCFVPVPDTAECFKINGSRNGIDLISYYITIKDFDYRKFNCYDFHKYAEDFRSQKKDDIPISFIGFVKECNTNTYDDFSENLSKAEEFLIIKFFYDEKKQEELKSIRFWNEIGEEYVIKLPDV